MCYYPKKPEKDKNYHSLEKPVLSRALLFCFVFKLRIQGTRIFLPVSQSSSGNRTCT